MVPNPVVWSLRAYQRLLRLYPPGFRAEYGEEMAHVFGDACRDRYRRSGARGVAAVWLETGPDVVVSVMDEHAQEDFAMARTQFARGLALGGFAAGALWIVCAALANMRPPGIVDGPARNLDDIGVLLIGGLPFLAAGLLGAYLRLASRWPVPAKAALLLALAGALWGAALSPLIDDYFFLFVSGFFVMDLCLLLTGLVLWMQRDMQRHAALFAGIGACCLLFNTEDVRVLFAAAAGLLMIALSALVFQGAPNRQGGPPLAM